MLLDHLVYAVPDLGAGIADFEARLGVAPVRGGRHTSLGTWNAILPLRGGRYVELIAADPEGAAPAVPRPFGLDDLSGPRLVTWAARTRDIDARVASARERGFDPGAVIAIGRETPEGARLEWRLSMRSEPAGGGVVPFLIDWGDAPHPSAVCEALCDLERFEAVHADPRAVRAMLDALDLSLPVAARPRVSLRATISGPAGTLVLGDTRE